MANHISALKRVRIEEKRTLLNRMRKTRLRHSIRELRRAMTKKDADAIQKLLPKTYSMVDRAAKWGVIKKNTAARYKSRLTARVKAVLTPAA
ncbi:MAG TPA: 30S ribosomal protein S20 [Bryobacteraceae bacterium]|nr:30S ribosomal protein S20 [Bryobacteraceae bacterium]